MTSRGSSSGHEESPNEGVVPVQRVCRSGSSSPWYSHRYSSSLASKSSMPSTSGSSSAPGVIVTGYGSIFGWERNWLPRVSTNTGKARGVVKGPSPLAAGGSMAVFVPWSANHRPPASTHARSACCAASLGRTSHV